MQVYNARKMHKMETKEEIFDLLTLLKEHQALKEGGFLRGVIITSRHLVLCLHLRGKCIVLLQP